jgi:pimeloyl-ACP methyl ester carboxylesterase
VLLLLPALAAAQPKAGHVVSEHATLRDEQGQAVAYEIGTLYVPENRDQPDSRLISVGYARIRALHPSDAPPIFWLPGGPGLSVLGAFANNDMGRLRTWLSLAAVADLVVVEQRGYSVRGEQLRVQRESDPLDRPASVTASAQEMKRRAHAAIAAHPGKDLAGYDIGAFADDVDDLRRALGYQRISLFGGSFGSQWSLAVMRRHPDVVARAVLSGVEPLDNGYDMPTPVYAALQRIAQDADRDPGLRPELPDGGMMAVIQALHERFARGPVTVRVRNDDGSTTAVVLGAEDLQLALLAHADEPEGWPAHLLALYRQDYQAWAREVIADRRGGDSILIGPLVDSSLGVTAGREQRLRSDPALAMLGPWNFQANIASAPDWPTRDMGDDFREPVASDIPLLLVHGDWDTSTPIDNSLELLPYFRNGHLIRVHRGGHDGAMYLLRNAPEARQAVLAFLQSGATANLPGEVELPPPTFQQPHAKTAAPAPPVGGPSGPKPRTSQPSTPKKSGPASLQGRSLFSYRLRTSNPRERSRTRR